jgi:hypothetical protein
MRDVNFNAEKISELNGKASDELEAFRTFLSDSIAHYKTSWIYRRRLKKSEEHPNDPQHPRLLDVVKLESIVNMHVLSTNLAKAVEAYVNKPENFRFAKLSPLRRGLNARLKEYCKSHDLNLIDSHLQLLKGVQAPEMEQGPSQREAINTDTASSINADVETMDFSQEPEEIVAVKQHAQASSHNDHSEIIDQLKNQVRHRDRIIAEKEEQLNHKQNAINSLGQRLQKNSKVLENTHETLVEATNMVLLLQEHVVVKDEIIAQQGNMIIEKNSSLKSLAESFKKYAKSATDLVNSLTHVLSGVVALLKISLRPFKGASMRKEIAGQLKKQSGNYHDLLANQKDTEKISMSIPITKILLLREPKPRG